MTPPKHLAAHEADLWRRLQAEYSIADSAGLALLTSLCEASQLARECREQVAAEGLQTEKGRAHPLLAVERDAKRAFLATLAALGLDLEQAGTVGRPVTPGGSVRRVK